MQITEQQERVILKVGSNLISANISQYNDSVIALLDRNKGFEELVLDLSETESIDSFGVSFVISLYKSCLNEGMQFKISNSSDDIIQLFRLMKLDEFFEMD